MKKRLYRGLSILLCLTLAGGQMAFAAPSSDNPEASTSQSTRGSSYSYVDLGTVTNRFSSTEVINSVDALSRIFSLGGGLPAIIARKYAMNLFKDVANRSGPFYYPAIVHTTQVFLDGEFVYYLLDSTTWIYSNPARTNLIATESYSGQSLSPASLDPLTAE